MLGPPTDPSPPGNDCAGIPLGSASSMSQRNPSQGGWFANSVLLQRSWLPRSQRISLPIISRWSLRI